jgi:hypothetical protein
MSQNIAFDKFIAYIKGNGLIASDVSDLLIESARIAHVVMARAVAQSDEPDNMNKLAPNEKPYRREAVEAFYHNVHAATLAMVMASRAPIEVKRRAEGRLRTWRVKSAPRF